MGVWLSYLRREVAAELEFLERDSHGVGAEEEDEGHEGQVGNVLTGVPDQRTAKLHTLLLTQLTPFHICQVKLERREREEGEGSERGAVWGQGGRVGGREGIFKKGWMEEGKETDTKREKNSNNRRRIKNESVRARYGRLLTENYKSVRGFLLDKVAQ